MVSAEREFAVLLQSRVVEELQVRPLAQAMAGLEEKTLLAATEVSMASLKVMVGSVLLDWLTAPLAGAVLLTVGPVLIGASRVAQINEAVEALSQKTFSDEELRTIDSVLAGDHH